MTTKRLAFLLAVLVIGFSGVFLLPKQRLLKPAAVQPDLPEFVGAWWSQPMAVSDYERASLGAETEFSKRLYTNGRGDSIQVMIVLSGGDMNTSIHRPERCLPAQGWTVINSRSLRIPLPKSNPLILTRLSNIRNLSQPDQSSHLLNNLAYYWFVGFQERTSSHLGRSWIDLRDRVFHGFNQRWAYILVASNVTSNLQKFGRDEKSTDSLLQEFVSELWPQISRPAPPNP